MKKILILLILMVSLTGAGFMRPTETIHTGMQRVLKIKFQGYWTIPEGVNKITTVSNWSNQYKAYVIKELAKQGYVIKAPALDK